MPKSKRTARRSGTARKPCKKACSALSKINKEASKLQAAYPNYSRAVAVAKAAQHYRNGKL